MKKTCEHCGEELLDHYDINIIIDENDNERKVCNYCKYRHNVNCVLIKQREKQIKGIV